MSIHDESLQDRPRKRYFRYIDALEVKPDFILGVPIEELAERLASKRGTSVSQALNYLTEIRGRDGWIRERELHLFAVNAHVQKQAMQDRAAALSAEQGAVADRLVQLGVDELATTRSVSRTEALKTLELGWKFHYRSIGQPDHVIDPSLLTAGSADAIEQGRRAEQLQNMSRTDLLGLIQELATQTVQVTNITEKAIVSANPASSLQE